MDLPASSSPLLPGSNPLYSPTHPLHARLLAAHAPVPGQEPLPRALLASLHGHVQPNYVPRKPPPQPHQTGDDLGLAWAAVRPLPTFPAGPSWAGGRSRLGSEEEETGLGSEGMWTPRAGRQYGLSPPSSYDKWEGRDKTITEYGLDSANLHPPPSSPFATRPLKRKATNPLPLPTPQLQHQPQPPAPPHPNLTLALPSPRRQHLCPSCGKEFVRPSALEIHARSHSKEQPFECATCARKFTVASNLRRHQQVFVRDRPPPSVPYSLAGEGGPFVSVLRRRKGRGGRGGAG